MNKLSILDHFVYHLSVGVACTPLLCVSKYKSMVHTVCNGACHGACHGAYNVCITWRSCNYTLCCYCVYLVLTDDQRQNISMLVDPVQKFFEVSPWDPIPDTMCMCKGLELIRGRG